MADGIPRSPWKARSIARDSRNDSAAFLPLCNRVQRERLDAAHIIDGNRLALTPGIRLGPYEILSALGAGGMGEVYRARDAKLNRDVAVKILPDSFAHDAERLARFRREAQVLAQLNHPHIGAIYGLEETGGHHFLVLELIDGDTLADRIAQGPIPLEDALPIARQIAEALEAAHERGIIHRDLKPANIKVTPEGQIKVLDFGLAKAMEPVGGPAQAGQYELSQSPTITSPAMMTGMGVILGTAAYMSPEQAKGREADKRSDIWAFGCVLYEMLTGKRPFDGEDVSDTLANVLKIDPDWSALPSPPHRMLDVLLEFDILIDREKGFEAVRQHQSKKLSVAFRRPSHFNHDVHVVTRKIALERPRDTFIEQ